MHFPFLDQTSQLSFHSYLGGWVDNFRQVSNLWHSIWSFCSTFHIFLVVLSHGDFVLILLPSCLAIIYTHHVTTKFVIDPFTRFPNETYNFLCFKVKIDPWSSHIGLYDVKFSLKVYAYIRMNDSFNKKYKLTQK